MHFPPPPPPPAALTKATVTERDRKELAISLPVESMASRIMPIWLPDKFRESCKSALRLDNLAIPRQGSWIWVGVWNLVMPRWEWFWVEGSETATSIADKLRTWGRRRRRQLRGGKTLTNEIRKPPSMLNHQSSSLSRTSRIQILTRIRERERSQSLSLSQNKQFDEWRQTYATWLEHHLVCL